MSLPVITLPASQLKRLGLSIPETIHYQCSPAELVHQCLRRGEGVLNNTGALVIQTGTFTGRSPKDRYIVKDPITANTVNWVEFNQPIAPHHFDFIFEAVRNWLNESPEWWARDCSVCADSRYRLNLRVITSMPSTNLFAYNMFLRPTGDELEQFEPDWHILAVPELKLDPSLSGTRSPNAVVLSFKHRMILVTGTGYTGEIKKAVFTLLNFWLPEEENVLPMHCSANKGSAGDTAIFFGLSGTGKTTLSADPARRLIGDDEHGWTDDNIFNFEGGCYAKCINLDPQKEPAIFKAIRPGALVENVKFTTGSNQINFADGSTTENTRVSYPLSYIGNALIPSVGPLPTTIFFLTCDAYGVLPPISTLTPSQAMYQFISGYTAKVAGTETGITEPKPTFSACFGAPFLPLHPGRYASLLGERIRRSGAKVWMINTGWTGGPFGTGTRIRLEHTRAMITAALSGQLDHTPTTNHPVFNIAMPNTCPGVPTELLNPRQTWADTAAYDHMAAELSGWFATNFEKYSAGVTEEIRAAAPKS